MIRSIAAVLIGGFFPLALACAADGEHGIPQLESSTVGWSKVADDFQPPASGPGPVTYEKDHPYVPNNDQGRQVTFRIADLTNPILKPWTIEKMREQNELAAAGKRAYEARASCRPGGVPGFLVMGRVNPLFFVQGKNEVLLINEGGPEVRREDPATIAWKLTTGAYYKDGGRPWQLADVRPGVCYVGLAYKRRDHYSDDRFAVCAAQMFLASGEGVVFRGALGPWYRADSEQYHLDEPAARNLVAMVVKEYRDQHEGAAPSELFLHAKSSFTDDEWKGFTSGAPTETNVVGVQIADAKDNLKLFRPGRYPIVRGSALMLADDQAFLWTAGYAPRLDTYLGPETPNPVLVRKQRGDCPFDTILRDLMGLTKINFNSCLHNDRLPVTIRFADAVGEIMLAAPQSGEPRLPFKFYI